MTMQKTVFITGASSVIGEALASVCSLTMRRDL
jgi:NADP-dependent 3-hydroxy acid dehydrogenase YdfG